MYFAFFFIYLALSIAFIVDVLRQPPTALSGAGKALWILALLARARLRLGRVRHVAASPEPHLLGSRRWR